MWCLFPTPLRLSLSKPARTVTALLLASPAAAQPPTLPTIEQVVVRKGERVIELYAGGRLVHTIKGIQLGDAPQGHKRFQGDERTPEGRYTIERTETSLGMTTIGALPGVAIDLSRLLEA